MSELCNLELSFSVEKLRHESIDNTPRNPVINPNGTHVLHQHQPGAPLPDGIVSNGKLCIEDCYIVKSNILVCEVANIKLVIKFKKEKRSRKEANAYKRLAQLQGLAIPIFYGLFETDNQKWCILLEYCGECIPGFLKYEAVDDKVVDTLKQFHKAGFKHGCKACESKSDNIRLATRLEYAPENMSCRELAYVCLQLGFFHPSPITVLGYRLKDHFLMSKDAEVLVPQLEQNLAFKAGIRELSRAILYKQYCQRASQALYCEGVTMDVLKADLLLELLLVSIMVAFILETFHLHQQNNLFIS